MRWSSLTDFKWNRYGIAGKRIFPFRQCYACQANGLHYLYRIRLDRRFCRLISDLRIYCQITIHYFWVILNCRTAPHNPVCTIRQIRLLADLVFGDGIQRLKFNRYNTGICAGIPIVDSNTVQPCRNSIYQLDGGWSGYRFSAGVFQFCIQYFVSIRCG